MPVLGTLFVALFAGLAEFFVLYVSKKLAIATAGVVALLAILGTLASVITGVVAGLAGLMPSDSWFMTGIYLGLPSNAAACMAGWLAIDAACAAYRIGAVKLRTYVDAF